MRLEKDISITATELARNISKTIDSVRMSRTSLLITRGSQVIAKLSPPPKQGLSVAALIDLLKSLPALDKQDSKQLYQDIQNIRSAATLPDNPWE